MGMKQPKTSRERRSARIEKKDRVKHGHLSFVNSESGDGSQVEGFEEMRNKERNRKIRGTLLRSLIVKDDSKMIWELEIDSGSRKS